MQPTSAIPPRELIEQLMAAAFAPSRNRTLRSPEYSAGARAALLQRFVGKPFACPHKEGTAEADAFFSGADEGRRLHADHLAQSAAKEVKIQRSGPRALAIIVGVLVLLGAALDLAALRG